MDLWSTWFASLVEDEHQCRIGHPGAASGPAQPAVIALQNIADSRFFNNTTGFAPGA
jgi:hypothetical protein